MAYYKRHNEENPEEILRVPLPKKGEVFGIVLAKVGGGKFKAYCADGNERICRIPGSKRRFMWINEDSIVIVKPWDVQSSERGDIVISYSKAQIGWLIRNKHLEELKDFL